MKVTPKYLTAVFALMCQHAAAEICLDNSVRDGSFDGMIGDAIYASLLWDVEDLALQPIEQTARSLSAVPGVGENGRPMLTTEYVIHLEPGHNVTLWRISIDQPEKFDSMFEKLQRDLTDMVCGNYAAAAATCYIATETPTARFVRAGGVLRYSVFFWGDWDGLSNLESHPVYLPPITISSCEAP
jgi:hypothetical protein